MGPAFTKLDNTRKPHENQKKRRMRLGAALSFIEVPTDVLHKDVFWGNEGGGI